MAHVDDAPFHPEQSAFEIYSMAMGRTGTAVARRQAMSKAHTNILERIRSVATPNCPPVKMDKPGIAITKKGLSRC
jgi:hypothetical protein